MKRGAASLWRLVTLGVASAALFTASLPAFDHGYVAWIAVAPLLYALRQRGSLAGAALGWVFGFAFGATAFYWLAAVPGITPLRFVVVVAVFGLYYMVFGLLYALASRSIGSWLVVGAPALWVALEYARASSHFLALPWNFLGHSQYQALLLIQVADFAGTYGVSFVLMMSNQLASQLPDLAAQAKRWRWRPQLAGFAAVTTATLLYGWLQLVQELPQEGRVRVAVVQANVAAQNRMSVEDQMNHLAAYDGWTREAAKESPELIVWPSSSLPGPIGFWMIHLYVSDIAQRSGATLLVGGAGGDKFAPVRDGNLPFSNSEFLISPDGQLRGQYNKIRLTPFNEQVPLQGVVTWPHWLSGLEASFVPGDSYTLFSVGAARFGTPICWENLFPDLFRRFPLAGANVMVSVTNESAFGTTGPRQTLAMNVFRAVENRIAIARAATTGVSGFIDAHGRILARVSDASGADVFVAGAEVRDLPLLHARSFYTLHGDVFAQLASAAALLIVSYCLWASLRGRRPRLLEVPAP
jgi:apolipoprotein N-acyltransferase